MKIPDRVRLFSYTQEDEEGAAAAGGEMCWRENKTCLRYTAESVKEKLFLVCCCCVLYISRSRLDSASGDVSRHQGQTTATPFLYILKIYYIYIYVRALLLQQCSVAIRYGPRERNLWKKLISCRLLLARQSLRRIDRQLYVITASSIGKGAFISEAKSIYIAYIFSIKIWFCLLY